LISREKNDKKKKKNGKNSIKKGKKKKWQIQSLHLIWRLNLINGSKFILRQ
jgi:hypothetical protein